MDQVLVSDCLSHLKTVPGETYDLVIADPPYFRIAGDFDFVWEDLDEYLSWARAWITEVHRTLKPTGTFYLWGVIGYNNGYPLFRLADWMESEGMFVVRNWITQRNSRGRGNKKGYMMCREELVYLTKGDDYTWNPQYTDEPTGRDDLGFDGKPRKNDFKRVSDVWIDVTEASQSSKERFKLPDGSNFPTVKAQKLCSRIIAASSNPGDLVYIPFGGSGSEAVACKAMGRNCVVTERNLGYASLIENRLLAHISSIL